MNTDINSIFEKIERNLPVHARWEGTFYEELTEYGTWNSKNYNVLIKDLQKYTELKLENNETPDLRHQCCFFELYSKIIHCIICHYDLSDSFQIKNIDGEKLYEYREALDLTFLAILKSHD